MFTAAQALSRRRLEDEPERLERLLALAVGAAAHPDLEVRVECARACVQHGRDEPVPSTIEDPAVLETLRPMLAP